MTTRRTMGARAHTAMLRKGRFDTAWSLLNAKLGGHDWKEHPNLMLIVHYSRIAPVFVKSRDWARFMKWYKTIYREVWNNGGSSWSP